MPASTNMKAELMRWLSGHPRAVATDAHDIRLTPTTDTYLLRTFTVIEVVAQSHSKINTSDVIHTLCCQASNNLCHYRLHMEGKVIEIEPDMRQEDALAIFQNTPVTEPLPEPSC